MKKFLLICVALICSANFASASPPDSCLWAPNLQKLLSGSAILYNYFLDDDIFNQDSTLYIDTCGINENFPYIEVHSNGCSNIQPGINHYCISNKKYYSNSLWIVASDYPVLYLFDTLNKDLSLIEFFRVEDINSNLKEIYAGFERAKNKYGEIRFRFYPERNISLKESIEKNSLSFNHSLLAIETEQLVNTYEFCDFLNDSIPQIGCYSTIGLSFHTSVNEKGKENFEISHNNEILNIVATEAIQDVTLLTLTGKKLYETTFSNFDETQAQINISMLQNGIYFLKVNENIQKFLVVR